MKTNWTDSMDEALLRTLKQGHADGAAFLAAYQKESGDTQHAIGGVMFRLETMQRILRLDVPDALMKDMKRLANAERDARKARAPVPPPPRKVGWRDSEAIERDGKTWLTARAVAKILGCTTMQTKSHVQNFASRDDIHPKGRNRKMYSRESVVTYAAARVAGGQPLSASKAPPAPTAKTAAPKAVAKFERCDRASIVMVDNVAYVRAEGAASILGLSAKTVRDRGREFVARYAITPEVPVNVPLYDRAEIVAFKARQEAEKTRLQATGNGEWTLDGEAVVEPKRLGEILGMDARTVGSRFPHKLVRRYHPTVRAIVYYTRASADALRRELDAEAAKKAPPVTETATDGAKANGHTATPTNGAARPKVLHMREMTLAQKLDAVNRALEQGIIDEHMHANKVRVIAAGG